MVFVTGGTGMVGAHLLLELTRRGEKVKALKRPSSDIEQTRKIFSFYEKSPDALFRNIEWVDGDLLDFDRLKALLSGIELIYHMAASVSFDRKRRLLTLENNVDGTANLINAAIVCGVKRFCHVSSIAALGRTENNESIDEKTMWTPEKKQSVYSQSKFFSEMEVWRGINEGIHAVIVNPGVILGPGNWKSGSPLFFSTVWNGLKYYTEGETGYVDVRDVVKAMLLLTDQQNWDKVKDKRYILCENNYSYRDILTWIAQSLRQPNPSIHVSDWMLVAGWFLSVIKSVFTRIPSLITREMVSGANKKASYSGKRIMDAIPDFKYTPISETINYIGSIFLAEHYRK